MAADGREITEIEKQCVFIPMIGQGLFCLSKRHLLSVSIVGIQTMVEVRMYTFVQQPPLTLHPNVIIIPGDHNNIQRIGYDDLRISESGNIIIFDASPISGIALGDIEHHNISNLKEQDTQSETEGVINSVVANAQRLSKLERQRNWFMQFREGKNSRIHKYYYHLQTNVVYRSLVEVYRFVEHGKLPDRYYKGRSVAYSKNIAEGSSSRRIRGSTLIRPKKVGYYDFSSNTIFRSPTLLEDIQESQEKDSKKRKRQEGLVDEVGQGSEDPHQSPLYDFEPLNN